MTVDAGARRALVEGGKSLLTAGVREVAGAFVPDAPVEIVGDDGRVFAKGLSRYGASQLRSVAGKRSADLPSGSPPEVVHRDDLVVLPELRRRRSLVEAVRCGAVQRCAVPSATGLPAPVKLDVTARDVAAFTKWATRQLRSRTERAFTYLLGAALGIAIVDCAFRGGFLTGVAAVAVLSFFVVLRVAGRRVNRSRSRLAAHSSAMLSVDESGVRQDTDHGSSTSTWAHFTALEATDEYLFLMTCPECAIIVPLRAFGTAEESGRFRDFVEARVAGSSTRVGRPA